MRRVHVDKDLTSRRRCTLSSPTGSRRPAFAREAPGSSVEHRFLSVYDLDPDEVGQFDVVFIGTLLHHLRDPVGALMAIRRVCRGQLLVSGVVSRDCPQRPVGNIAGLRRQIESAGFAVERRGPLHFQPTGGARVRDPLPRTLAGVRILPTQAMLRKGVPHVCMRARRV